MVYQMSNKDKNQVRLLLAHMSARHIFSYVLTFLYVFVFNSRVSDQGREPNCCLAYSLSTSTPGLHHIPQPTPWPHLEVTILSFSF